MVQQSSTPAVALSEGPEIWTVSQITRRVKGLLEEGIGHVWISGEVSNFRVSPAGHSYFTLKDATSQISAVMFKGKLARLRFEPESGMEVLAHGLVSVYEQRGAYQIICDDMQPKGVGALQLAFEQLRKKLEEEGLFAEEHKKPLPFLPVRIGIVTSPTGAAIRDILNVIHRRFANVHVLLYPARVQGDEAAPEIAEGIRALDAWGVDVMIVGRGGGSMEDLWPFNEEAVVRAIYESATPIISAVGHEIDFTLSDFVADVRAPTPSAAAELVVKEHATLSKTVDVQKGRLAAAMERMVEKARGRLQRVQSSYLFQRPEEIVRERRQRYDDLRMQLDQAMGACTEEGRIRLERAVHSLALLSPAQQLRRGVEHLEAVRRRLLQAGVVSLAPARARFGRAAAQLDTLSPLSILSRGYALVQKLPALGLVHGASDLEPKDKVKLTFGRGSATAIVEGVDRGRPDAV